MKLLWAVLENMELQLHLKLELHNLGLNRSLKLYLLCCKMSDAETMCVCASRRFITVQRHFVVCAYPVCDTDSWGDGVCGQQTTAPCALNQSEDTWAGFFFSLSRPQPGVWLRQTETKASYWNCLSVRPDQITGRGTWESISSLRRSLPTVIRKPLHPNHIVNASMIDAEEALESTLHWCNTPPSSLPVSIKNCL